MYMYVCMYEYMYVCIMYVCMYVCMYLYTHMHTHIHAYIHPYIYTHTYILTYTHIHIIHNNQYLYVCTYIHQNQTHTHIVTHTNPVFTKRARTSRRASNPCACHNRVPYLKERFSGVRPQRLRRTYTMQLCMWVTEGSIWRPL